MARACFQYSATSNGEAYFFSGSRYARIKVIPSSSDDKIIYGPTKFASEWSTLVKTGFESIDAVLPAPGPGNEKDFYFFSGTRYARIRFTPGTPDESIIFGPAKITDHWVCLAKAAVDRVDAVMPIAGTSEAYFFRGENYVRVNLSDDSIVFGPAKIVDHWPSLVKSGFDVVDAILPIPDPGYEGQAYFFRGDQYSRIKVVPGSKSDEITFGPALIAKEWKSLASWDW
ncbi:Hemopexin [Podospora aff. communis PSN243]|uniref:Hemopexin n=1 Tax=Podospora aff. communis PSN243 TaxID=3040156 RepID=A0AAV9GE32_9PEZI|nr:Hemopexin [Podospora aff. communis PSN243]